MGICIGCYHKYIGIVFQYSVVWPLHVMNNYDEDNDEEL